MLKQAHPITWQSHAFQAMGSHIVLWLESSEIAAARSVFDQVEALFEANEQALSRFRPDSELSQLNAHSGNWVPVSDLLWRQVKLAVKMAEITHGRFDPTLLKALAHAGYVRSFETMASGGWNESQFDPVVALGQWQAIEFNDAQHALKMPLGVEIDLGGIAKGDTAQQAIGFMQDVGPCLIDAGGDLVAGAAPEGEPGWPVSVGAPRTGSEADTLDLASLWLAEGAMATSGVDYRKWQHNGTLVHHIIDPATGSPARSDGLTVTILAKDAAAADAWATATLVAGSTLGMDALLDHELAGLMITRDGRILVTPEMDRHLQGQVVTPIS